MLERGTENGGLAGRIAGINAAWRCSELRPLAKVPKTTDIDQLHAGVPSEYASSIIPKPERYKFLADVAHAMWDPILRGDPPELARHELGVITPTQYEGKLAVLVLPPFDLSNPTSSIFDTINLLHIGLNEKARAPFAETLSGAASTYDPTKPDHFPEYYEDTLGGAFEGVRFIALAFSASVAGLTEDGNHLPPVEKVAQLMKKNRSVITQLLKLNFYPQKVLDALAGEQVEIFKLPDAKSEQVEMREDVLDFLTRLGKNVATNPLLAESDGDSEEVFSQILASMPNGWVGPNDRELLIDKYNNIRQRVKSAASARAEKDPAPLSTVMLVSRQVDEEEFTSEKDETGSPDKLSQKTLLKVGSEIMVLVNKYHLNMNQRETIGCPTLYDGVFPRWYEYWNQTLLNWYKLDNQPPAQSETN